MKMKNTHILVYIDRQKEINFWLFVPPDPNTSLATSRRRVACSFCKRRKSGKLLRQFKMAQQQQRPRFLHPAESSANLCERLLDGTLKVRHLTCEVQDPLSRLQEQSKTADNFFSCCTNREISSSSEDFIYDLRKNSSISKSFDQNKSVPHGSTLSAGCRRNQMQSMKRL